MSDRAVDDEITQLAVAAGRGDRAAANALIRNTQRDIWRFLVYLVGAEDAERLSQETYVRALTGVRKLRGNARTWLLATARRIAAEHLSAGENRPRIATDPAHLPGGEDSAAITRAVRTLPIELRDAFVLTQVLGLDYASAGEVCDGTVAEIRARVAQARRELVSELAPGMRPSHVRRSPAAPR
jgi:RNA polymerase sigma-70 factor (ECF subfamily)